jgi:hypothetical protein
MNCSLSNVTDGRLSDGVPFPAQPVGHRLHICSDCEDHFKWVKLSCPATARQAARGRECITPTHSWPRHYMGVNGQRQLFTPGKGPPGTHRRGGWVGPRAGLVTEAAQKIILLCWGSSPGSPVRSETLHRLSYPSSSLQMSIKSKAAGTGGWLLTSIQCRGWRWWSFTSKSPYVFIVLEHKKKFTFFITYYVFQLAFTVTTETRWRT